ncbi:MAG: DUF2905 domain-containing protein [Nitrospinae bacterium]|nr:DUF2905 domain-containing protein [Nitrospinota bacterium]
MSRLLIFLGLAILVLGISWPLIQKLGLGRLPGDIVVERENFTFHFPVATMILVSVAVSLLLNLFFRFFGK